MNHSRALNAECKLQNSLSKVIYLPRATSSFEENSYLRWWKIEKSSEAVTIDASDEGDLVMGLREGLWKTRETKAAFGVKRTERYLRILLKISLSEKVCYHCSLEKLSSYLISGSCENAYFGIFMLLATLSQESVYVEIKCCLKRQRTCPLIYEGKYLKR